MEELLPYYERELGFLRRYSREFSERYPKIAGRLLIAGELALTRARFAAILEAPDAAAAPLGASSSLSLTLETTADVALALAQLGLASLRVFIDGEPSFCAALRDALFMRPVKAWIETGHSGRWSALAKIPVTPAGFAEDDALIAFSARSHPAYRLLTEYFWFPEKFNFFDIDLGAVCAALPAGARKATLHLALAGTCCSAARRWSTCSTRRASRSA